MSSATETPNARTIWRHQVLFCVLPADLGRHLGELKRFYAETEDIEFVVERRGGERRRMLSAAPDGVERRVGHRREPAMRLSAARAELELPRSLRRHADRIFCTWRMLPVRFQDLAAEADELWSDADTDGDAQDELRLRYHGRVLSSVSRMVPPRRALDVTDLVFDDLFAHHDGPRFDQEVSRATGRVLAQR